MTPKILIRLDDVNVTLSGQPVLRRVCWQLREKENWAVLGPNGSGKSTFLKLVRGDLWPDPPQRERAAWQRNPVAADVRRRTRKSEIRNPKSEMDSAALPRRLRTDDPRSGRRIYSFDSTEQHSPVGIRERIAMVSPEMQERYLQQDWTLTGETVIHTGFFASELLYQRPNRDEKKLADAIIDSLGLSSLRAKNVQELSTGELRKILIARALVRQPRLLILDEFCDGLDHDSRDRLLSLVEHIARSGTQILYTTHRAEEIIPSITHLLVLEAGTILQQGTRADLRSMAIAPEPDSSAGCQPAVSPIANRQTVRGTGEREPAAAWQDDNLRNPDGSGAVGATAQRRARSDAPDLAQRFRETPCDAPRAATNDFLIRITNADVFLNRKKILRDLNWQMHADENWAVLGNNASGKTTFLKLIFGDLYPALGGEVHRFTDGAPRTVWRTKARIGYVSADFQANYRADVTGEEVVASGFFSSVGLLEKPSRQQMARARDLIHGFGLPALAQKNILQMSYGELRKLLLLRALVNDPKLLLLDEPFDGLDAASRAQLSGALEQVVRGGTWLIVVTHHGNDLPPCMTHALYLHEGRIVHQARIGAHQAHLTPIARRSL